MDKQTLQAKHSFIVEYLKKQSAQLPIEFQRRLNGEFLALLSSSLLDGTVFEIVKSLSEMQQISERKLFKERCKIQNEYLTQREQLLNRHKATEKACEIKPHHLSIVLAANKRELDAFDKRMTDELHRFDMRIVAEWDGKVREQQETMNQAGVHGFFVTDDREEVTLQMHLLSFIVSLSKLQIGPV